MKEIRLQGGTSYSSRYLPRVHFFFYIIKLALFSIIFLQRPLSLSASALCLPSQRYYKMISRFFSPRLACIDLKCPIQHRLLSCTHVTWAGQISPFVGPARRTSPTPAPPWVYLPIPPCTVLQISQQQRATSPVHKSVIVSFWRHNTGFSLIIKFWFPL